MMQGDGRRGRSTDVTIVERDPVESGRRRLRICPHVFPDDPVSVVKSFRKVVFLRDDITAVTCRSEDGSFFSDAFDESTVTVRDIFHAGRRVVEFDTVERTVNTFTDSDSGPFDTDDRRMEFHDPFGEKPSGLGDERDSFWSFDRSGQPVTS